MTRKREAVKQPDIARLRGILASAPQGASIKQIALLWGRNPVTTGTYVKLLRESGPTWRAENKALRVKGALRTIFEALDKKELTIRQQALEAGVAAFTITRWRNNISSPSLFMVECLAQMAGMKLAVEEAQDAG